MRYDRLSEADDGRKQMVTAHMTVFEDGVEAGQIFPARWFFRKHESEPTTEVAIRRTLSEDLYVVLAAYELGDQSASFQVTLNPLLNWLWIGFGFLALGTGISLLPESSFAFVSARVPDGAATTSLLILALLLGAHARPVQAQVADATPESYVVDSELEGELQRELVCVCGTCPHFTLADCKCPTAAYMRGLLREQVDLGKNEREIKEFFIETYGSQEPLGAPLDEGFNRLAWLFPYLVGGGFLVAIGAIAVRWTRRDDTAELTASATPEAADAQLEARLDDELRNLD